MAAPLPHDVAREIVRRAFARVIGREASEDEITHAQAIASLETGYGRAGQFGYLADRGHYNWGALERAPLADGSCPPGTAPGSDVGSVCFYVFDSDEDAAVAFLRTLVIGSQRSAARAQATLAAMSGTPEDVARAMRTPPAYYEGYPGSEASKQSAYAKAIRRNIQAAGNPEPPSSGGNAASGNDMPGLLALGVVVTLGALAVWFYQAGGVDAIAEAIDGIRT